MTVIHGIDLDLDPHQRLNDTSTFGLRLTADGPDDIVMLAEVALLEPLGAETLVTLKIGATERVARCSASFRESPGSRLHIHLNPRHG